MRKFIAATASACVALVSQTAYADDVSWSGPYVGVTVGGAQHQQEVSSADLVANGYDGQVGAYPLNSSGTGAIGGIELGYNQQFGSVVVGLEGDFSIANAGGQTANNSAWYNGSISSHLKNMGTIRGRLGVAAGRALIYATGGVAFGRVKAEAYDQYEYTGPYPYSVTNTRTGYIAGAGAEYSLGDGVSVKVEGLYYNLGTDDIADQDGGTYAVYQDKAEGTILRAGVNVRF